MQYRDLRFNEQGKQVIELARVEADRLHHEYIGTEHLVLAMIHHGDEGAGVALNKLNIDRDGVRATIASIVKTGNATPNLEAALPYTSRTQEVFELAYQYAQELGQSSVGSGHLLVGVLREGKGIGGQVLLHHGLTVDAAIEQVRKLAN